MKKAITYTTYLQLDQILSAQQPESDGPEHDEMLFIIIHQVYELWFKQMLHEIDFLQDRLLNNDQPRALHTLRRLLTILKTVVAQIDVLETMTPLEFNSFRGFLQSASGFQSAQFRQLEFALGHKRPNFLNHFPPDTSAHHQLNQRFQQPSLWDAFLHYLHNNGYDVPPDHLNRDVTTPISPSPDIQNLLINLYHEKENSMLRLCERLVDLDEGLQEWRYRHIKMIERTIGAKPGTGGSAGASYLRTTLNPFFPDLWAIRSQL
ncbi:MAG TPA: tryptophan 2,3-dioxygenase family protein [Anaerolineae bacterium]|nr:tryptophan 2,3-dioxygenase family protein [Anaerolineae bacterium]